MPFAFLAGLLRTHLSLLDAELRASLAELRASRARIVEAGDAERRRLERDLHDGAQSRLVALKLLLSSARLRARGGRTTSSAMLGEAIDELDTSLSELRELARGIHPAVLTDHGLEPALQALASRAPVPVTVEADAEERLPGAVESAAYFVVSEALANVAKYAQATEAAVAVRRTDGRVTVDVTDDGDRRRRRRARLGPARPGRPRRRARRDAVAGEPGRAAGRTCTRRSRCLPPRESALRGAYCRIEGEGVACEAPEASGTAARRLAAPCAGRRRPTVGLPQLWPGGRPTFRRQSALSRCETRATAPQTHAARTTTRARPPATPFPSMRL